MGVLPTNTWHILRKEIAFKPYNVKLVHKLIPRNYFLRRRRCGAFTRWFFWKNSIFMQSPFSTCRVLMRTCWYVYIENSPEKIWVTKTHFCFARENLLCYRNSERSNHKWTEYVLFHVNFRSKLIVFLFLLNHLLLFSFFR